MDSNGEEKESSKSLYNFLQDREVDVNKLKEKKIDCKVILEMDDRELSKFIPRYGDRVLVRSFLRKQNSPNTRNPKRKSKGAKKDEIIKLGKQIFFGKDGISKLGSVADFNFEIKNFEGEVVDDTFSVGDLYTATGLTLLTFYILLTPVEEESLPKLSLPKKSVKIDEQHEKEQTDEKEQDENDLTHSVGTDIIAEAMLSLGVADFDGGDSLDSIPDFFEHIAFLEPENIDVPGDFSLPVEEPATLNEALTQNQNGPMVLNDFRVSHPSPMMTETQKIRVHRSDLLNDMITIFKQQDIIQRKLMFEYVNEIGSDLDGVSRDVYSSFWIEFLRCSSEGEECRVPALNSRWQADEWMSIGRIMAKGYQDHQIFPLQLSKVTTIVIAFGEETVTSADLFNYFLHFVSQTDRDLIQAALKDDLKGEDKDELLDLLERFQCSINPSKDNMKSIIDKIAHKELIQKPKYAMDNMAITCRETFMGTFLSVDKLLEIYVNLEPTPRKFLKLLKVSPITNAENASLRFFQQYVRGQNTESLRKLLGFLTGSETITVPKIHISFTQLEGFNRRHIAHTCGPSLELTYSSYRELRMEMDSILSDDSCFVMNIA
ncbi:unnamed protein product [Mytilus coruscus]|uniref:HECT domain-containing protein n=1 Tax=Mytilus coruscus TaxID=42192 RepID=A0A6J8BMB7_MYTCO|nr:unnamed protein product [Mytilus coruscus]